MVQNLMKNGTRTTQEISLLLLIIHQATILMQFMAMVFQQKGSIHCLEVDGNHLEPLDKETALLELRMMRTAQMKTDMSLSLSLLLKISKNQIK
jgi:hypothetical protein